MSMYLGTFDTPAIRRHKITANYHALILKRAEETELLKSACRCYDRRESNEMRDIMLRTIERIQRCETDMIALASV